MLENIIEIEALRLAAQHKIGVKILLTILTDARFKDASKKEVVDVAFDLAETVMDRIERDMDGLKEQLEAQQAAATKAEADAKATLGITTADIERIEELMEKIFGKR